MRASTSIPGLSELPLNHESTRSRAGRSKPTIGVEPGVDIGAAPNASRTRGVRYPRGQEEGIADGKNEPEEALKATLPPRPS